MPAPTAPTDFPSDGRRPASVTAGAAVPLPAAHWSSLFQRFAREDCPEDPLYQSLCEALAGEPSLLALMDAASPEQARPNLYLAALHYLVMKAPDSALAAYFPSVGGLRAPDAGLAAVLTAFVREQEAALRELLAQRATQTNEIGRCAVLWPALQHLARAGGRSRLALFDFGCSAGLNLGVDAYGYHYRHADGRTMHVGMAADADIPCIEAQWLGTLPELAPRFELVCRLGVDPSPLQAADPADAAWLQACLWPHDHERRARLKSALALARRHRWPVIRALDGLAVLESWLDGLPCDVQPVLFNSWVLYYFQEAERQRHTQRVEALMASRDLWWLCAESLENSGWPVECPLAERPANLSSGSATLWQWRRAGHDPVSLAWSHPHGRLVHWLAPAP